MKTELELNTELAELLGMKVATIDDLPYRPYRDNTREDVYQDYRERYPNTVWALAEGEPWEQFVYTRDWSQLMPVVVGLGVEYKRVSDGRYMTCCVSHGGLVSSSHAVDETLQIALVKSCISTLKDKE